MSSDIIKHYKINKFYVFFYALTIGINGICVAWTTGGNNQTAPIFAAKFGWSEKETMYYNTMINFSS